MAVQLPIELSEISISMPPDCESALIARLLAALGASPLLDAAVALARRAHAGALRDDGTPYLCHPLRSALILVDEAGVRDPKLVCAAVLHDVLEDGPGISRADVAAACGEEVARIVHCLTNELRDTALPRDERKRRYLQRVAAAGDDCLLVKLCDRLDNLRSFANLDDQDRSDRVRRETKRYLLPALEGRSGALETLGRLLLKAIDAPDSNI
jgi:(p)ppGpp synthase/HD superfamily hydrolase